MCGLSPSPQMGFCFGLACVILEEISLKCQHWSVLLWAVEFSWIWKVLSSAPLTISGDAPLMRIAFQFTFEVSQGTLLVWWAVCLVPSSLCELRHLLQEWDVFWIEGEPSSHSVHPQLRSPLSLEHCVSQTIWRWTFRYLFHLWHSCVCACVNDMCSTVWRGQIPFSNLCLSCF